MGLFVMLGMDQALNAYFFDGDATHQRDLVKTAVVFVGGMSVVGGVGLALCAHPLAKLLYRDSSPSIMFYLLAVSMVSSSVYGLLVAGLRLKMDVKRVNVLGLVFLGATVAANLTLVVILRLKAVGVIASNAIVNLLACSVAVIAGRDFVKGRVSFKLLRLLLPAGIALIPGTLSTLLLLSVDRLLLTQFVSQSDIGLYSIANKLASMMWVLFSASGYAWLPMALEMAHDREAPHQYARVFEFFAVAWAWTALALGLFAPEILALFTRTVYVPAAPYALALLIFTGPLSQATACFNIVLYARKRTFLVSLGAIVAAPVNIILNLVLDPLFGVWGAVWATILAGLVMVLVAYYAAQQTMQVPYRLVRLLALDAVYLGLLLSFLLVPALNTLLFKFGALLVLAVTALGVGIVSRQQLEASWQSLLDRLKGLARSSHSDQTC
jgi:O-antigen/teichoic acid export membrane protein